MIQAVAALVSLILTSSTVGVCSLLFDAIETSHAYLLSIIINIIIHILFIAYDMLNIEIRSTYIQASK